MLLGVAIGTLAQWLTLVSIAAVAWVFFRGGSGTAIGGLTETNRELERQLKEREGKISALERINAELRAEKDVTVAIVPVIEALKSHENMAAERQRKTLIVLDLIAEKLGPENGQT